MNHNLIVQIPSILWANYYFELYLQAMGWQDQKDIIVDVMDIYDSVIYPDFDFSLKMDMDLGMHNGQKVLGKTIIDERIILIDQSIAPATNDPRFAFTLGHEIGHVVLHQQENKQLFRSTASTFSNKYDPLEREANYFAAQLLMPSDLVLYRFQKHYGMRNPYPYTGRGIYGINGEDIYIRSLFHLCLKLATPLTCYFSNVSKESLGYTLHNNGLIANQTKEPMGPNALFLPPTLNRNCHDACRAQQ